MEHLKDYLAPFAIFALLYLMYQAILSSGNDARISANLGMLHELLQLNPDDHSVTWEDGTEGTVPEAIDYYVGQLIEELRV